MKRKLPDLATTLMVCCALLITIAVVRREFFPSAAAAQPDTKPRPVKNWDRIATAGQRMGPAGTPVQIVEFSDFQCPYCATFAETLRKVRAKHPGRVSVLYRHYPIEEIHPYARTAALAAECAGEQGRFEAYHDALFARQDSIGTRAWERFASDAGVADVEAFTRCVREERLIARVDDDTELAEETGIRLTPSLVINGTLIPGALSETELEKWITKSQP